MKIFCFMFGVFIVATVAGSGIENIVRGTRHISGRHPNRLEDSNSENQDEVNDGSRHHHHFKHDADWHRRHGIPMPDEVNGSRFNSDGEHRHHFKHNPEWHRRNGFPMHDHRNHRGYYPRPNHRNPTSTTSTTTSTTTEPFDWDMPTSTGRSTVQQPDSREIFDNTHTNTENNDTEMINIPSRRTSTTTERSNRDIRTSTARTPVVQWDSRDIFNSPRTNTDSTSTARTVFGPADWDRHTSTTADPEYSREIYDNKRTHTEYDDTEMINMP